MTILDDIVAHKREEVALLKQRLLGHPDDPVNAVLRGDLRGHCGRFKAALSNPAKGINVIAEIKRKSPSAGSIGAVEQPSILALKYQQGNASAISCLTDNKYFGGSLEDLCAVVEAVDIPVLRKDFTVDEVQIAEAVVAGASAVLLIVAVLGGETRAFLQACDRMGVDALVEVHDEAELRLALEAGAEILGVNNRNLKTFETSLETCLRLVQLIPPQGVIRVAESGLHSADDTCRVAAAGFQAALIGEALVKAADPSALLTNMSTVS